MSRHIESWPPISAQLRTALMGHSSSKASKRVGRHCCWQQPTIMGKNEKGKENGACIIVVQLPSRVQIFVTPWTAACQAFLCFTISRSLIKLMSIGSVMPSNYLILCNRHTHLSVQFSHSVMSNSLWPHELQHARPPCPSPTPGVHSNSCPSSQWCHPAISSSVLPFSSCPQSLPASESFPMSQLFTNLSFSIIPSKKHPGLVSFRMDWLDLLAGQGTESSPTPQFKNINSSALSFLHSPTLTSIHDHWKNHSLD